jgi:hypothetical protein
MVQEGKGARLADNLDADRGLQRNRMRRRWRMCPHEDSTLADSMDTTELEMVLKKWGDEEENSRLPSAEEMAAIPVASPKQPEARRSKRRVGEVDEVVGVTAERCKSLRNEGISVDPAPSSLVNDSMVISNLNAIGIALGDDDASIVNPWLTLEKRL